MTEYGNSERVNDKCANQLMVILVVIATREPQALNILLTVYIRKNVNISEIAQDIHIHIMCMCMCMCACAFFTQLNN